MYFKVLNILICSADGEMEKALSRIRPQECFDHHFLTIPGELGEENFTFMEKCMDADIVILDVPPVQIPSNLTYLCAARMPRFVYCERLEWGALNKTAQLDQFHAIWMAPFTPERLEFFFTALLKEIKAQLDLQLARHCLDTAIDSVPDLIWFKDSRGAHMKVNEGFCRLVGKTKEQCRGRGHYYIWDMDAEEYGKGEYVCLESENMVMRARKTCVLDEKLKGPDGSMMQFKTYKSPLFDADGKIIGTMGIARDVTNFQKLSEELNLVLNSIPDPAMLVDASGSIINGNKALADLVHEDSELLAGQDYAQWKAGALHIGRPLEDGEHLRITYAPSYGPARHLEVSEAPIYDVFQQIGGWFCLFRDVTEHLNHMDLIMNYQKQLERDVAAKTEQIQAMQQQILISFADLVNSRDNITGSHIRNTSKYVYIIVDELRSMHYFKELDDEVYCRNVIRSAPMHDIGKIAIPDVILNKPGKFTPEEFEIMKRHAALGGEILDQVLAGLENPAYYQVARDMAVYHHEKWNGQGYPYGKKGEDIPLCARIMAVADVFDALISERPYKKPFSIDRAYGIICHDVGIHFDARIVEAFTAARDAIEVVIEEELSDGTGKNTHYLKEEAYGRS